MCKNSTCIIVITDHLLVEYFKGFYKSINYIISICTGRGLSKLLNLIPIVISTIKICSIQTAKPLLKPDHMTISLKSYFKYLKFYFILYFNNLKIWTICTFKHKLKFWLIIKITAFVITVWNFDLRIFSVYGRGNEGNKGNEGVCVKLWHTKNGLDQI